jgi:hypothetical protein
MDVNIRDKRGEDALVIILAIGAAIIAGVIIFGIFPGIFLTSIINYFFYFTTGQLWGLSIVLSLAVLFYLKNKYSEWQIAFTKYAIVATVTGCLIGFSALFIKYNFSVRTVMRMFDSHNKIPYNKLTAPSEVTDEILGRYVGDCQNLTLNKKGEVILRIFSVNSKTDSVSALIEWSGGLSGYNSLTGTLKNNKINLFTEPSDENGFFKVNIVGDFLKGKTNCKYKIAMYEDNEEQEGEFSAQNIGPEEE